MKTNNIIKKLVMKILTATTVATITLGLAGVIGPLTITTFASTVWSIGDVYAGVGGGNYNVYDNAGVFKETINDGSGAAFTTGCAFNNALDKLYTTNFSNGNVVAYDDASPHAIAQTIATGDASPESVVFAANGEFYVGHADGTADIQRYDSAGVLQQSYNAATEARGSDWLDLASDQMTMYYTSEGRKIMRYDVSADVQLADFADLTGVDPIGTLFALRLLPPGDGTGGLIVADRDDIKRLDGAGAVAQTYDVAGEDNWFSLNLDPNGTSFWAGDFGTNNFYRLNIATGAVEIGPIASGGILFGLCIKGELTAAKPEITLDPLTATNPAGSDHTVTATVEQGGQPVVGTLVSFSVTSGPNIGQVSDPGECAVDPNCNTDAIGQTSWTYTSNGAVGTDIIEACFSDEAGVKHCAKAEKTWFDETPPKASCVETTNPSGKNTPKAPGTGQNEDGFYQLMGSDNVGVASIVVRDSGSSFVSNPFANLDKVKITQSPGVTPSDNRPGPGVIVSHLKLKGDAILRVTDLAGNVTESFCLVPPPPK